MYTLSTDYPITAPTHSHAAIFQKLRTEIMRHFKNTVVFPYVPSSAFSFAMQARACKPFLCSRVFAFEPALLSAVVSDEEIIGATAAGYATVIDAALQQQLSALGLTCSMWYRLAGEMEARKIGKHTALHIIEKEIMMEITIY